MFIFKSQTIAQSVKLADDYRHRCIKLLRENRKLRKELEDAQQYIEALLKRNAEAWAAYDEVCCQKAAVSSVFSEVDKNA